VPGVIAFLPAIKGLRRDAEIATSETGIVIMGLIVMNHLSLCLAFFDNAGMLAKRFAPGIVL